ncbi:hypothetical protein EUX98_g5700 [Antrodiella citrinella]|uniref:Uncharacterized protein n=1 Tax=Antrodiella citrinella TaxID=2447956 RepID=A0A4S4MT04_9APHY|nr:hypothetical protein EUX98_g5700 [Antrodiella citrinella]
MHASTIAILAIAAAAAPAFSQPIYAREDAFTGYSRRNELEARKIKASDIKDGIDIGNSLIGAAGNLKQVITGHSRREVGELLTRALEEELMARQDATDTSGASIFSIAKDAFDVGKTVYDAFKGSGSSNNNGNNKREEELFLRAFEEELMARQDATDASGASIFSIAKDAFDVGKTVYDAFKGSGSSNNNGNNKREEELFMRALEDELIARQDASGAFKISAGDIKDGIDIGNGIINAAGNLKQVITGHSKRGEPLYISHTPIGHGPAVVNTHYRIGTTVAPRAVPARCPLPLPSSLPTSVRKTASSALAPFTALTSVPLRKLVLLPPAPSLLSSVLRSLSLTLLFPSDSSA